MRVAIVGGAGALGSVYGARLATLAACDVSIVARSAGPGRVVRLERVEDGGVIEWTAPARAERVDANAEIVLACVRYEQLDSVAERVGGTGAPVVFLTPMLPDDHARLAAALPGRVVAGMPSVVAYANESGALRYWLPGVASTLVEERQPAGAETALVAALERAGIGAKLDAHALERNVATTITFAPIAMALDVAGSIDVALDDDALLSLALSAEAEGREIARSVGKPAAWASLLARFVGPLTLKVGVSLARTRSPEAVEYVEKHFGHKLHAQNVAMADAIVRLARDRGIDHAAIEQLRVRLS